MNYTAYVIVTESTLLHVKVQKLKRKLRGGGGPGDGAGLDGQTGGGYGEVQGVGRRGAELAGRGEQLVRAELDGAEKS
jgi:hypothetical protein